MVQAVHLDGPALRAFAARASAPAFEPPEATAKAHKGRDRIWELADTLHCSIVGTCLTNADARALLSKLAVPEARSMSEHRLHGQVVRLAGRRDGGGKLLQKMLDRRHEREIRRFDAARSAEDVRALWRACLDQGEVPGAYWAAITHPATDWTLVQDIFGEVHMLSHLVGQSNRADIRRLRALEADLAARDETVAVQARRIHDLSARCEGLRQRTASDAQALRPAGGTAGRPRRDHERDQERVQADRTVSSLQARLSRERAHAAALEEKVAVLAQAAERLSADLEAESATRRAAEAELAAAEALLAAATARGIDGTDEEARQGGVPADAGPLEGRRMLYVGGRPRQVAALRRLARAGGGQLLVHDGGIEDSMSLLPGLVGQADLVLFPVDCVSHEATATVKRVCEATGTPFRPLRSAGLTSFVHAVSRAASRPGDG